MQQNTKSHFIHPHLFYLREEVWLILVFLKHRPHTQKRVEDIFMFVFCVHVGVQNVCGTRVVMLSQIHCTVAFSMHIAKNVSLSSSHNTAQQFSWDADCVHRGSSLGNLNMSVLWQAGQWMIHCLNCVSNTLHDSHQKAVCNRPFCSAFKLAQQRENYVADSHAT